MLDGYTDIKLDKDWQLTEATNGDAPIITSIDGLIQDIKLESLTQEGELFYDTEYGWSLLDFIQCEDNDMTRLEISERVRDRLSRRDIVNSESVGTDISFINDEIQLTIAFKLKNSDTVYSLDISLNRINVEVLEND